MTEPFLQNPKCFNCLVVYLFLFIANSSYRSLIEGKSPLSTDEEHRRQIVFLTTWMASVTLPPHFTS